eukprot:6186538-Amphidinium_carterae.1
MSAKVTRLGVCGGALTSSTSGDGERASGAVQAGRRESTSQDLGAPSAGSGYRCQSEWAQHQGMVVQEE